MKHNYPKNRKKAIKKNSQKHRLLAKYPLKYIQQTWVDHGMYKGAEKLSCNPFVLFHLARELDWKRPLPPHLLKAVKSKCWEISNSHYIPKEEN